MAPKKSAAPKEAVSTERVASVSKMPKGSGSRRVQTRVITVYGPFKSRKTTSLANLPAGRTKWVVSDPNAVPTLRALDRMPHEDDIYEVNNLESLREFLESTLKLAEDAVDNKEDPRAALGIDFLVLDSWTQFFDWLQQDIAKATGQRFMGDDDKNNGWQRFNAEFGACLDLWAALGRYVTVISIVHAKAKFDKKKGEYASFSLSPAMAEKLGRLSNWILLKNFDEVIDDTKREDAFANPEDPYYEVSGSSEDKKDDRIVYEDVFYTKPIGGYAASINSLKFRAQEPGKDITLLLEKDGLL